MSQYSSTSPPPHHNKLQLDISVLNQNGPQKADSKVIKYAESRWQSLLGNFNWDLLLPHVDNALYRTRSEEIMYKKLLSRRLEVNHYRTSNPYDRLCSFCHEQETIEHLYGDCASTKLFLSWLRDLVSAQIGIDIPHIDLRNLIYFFPGFTHMLNPEQLRVLGIAHSISLIAIWEARTSKSPPDYAIQFFSERFYSRLECDPSPRRGSDSSDAPSLTTSSATGSGGASGRFPEKDFTDVLQDVLHSNVTKFNHDEVLGNLLALYE
jgi:hypothetical protein